MKLPVLLAILVTQTIGGLSSIFTKLALEGLEPWTMVFLRQALGLGILFAMARSRPIGAPRNPFTRRDWLLVVVAGWGGFALPQALLAIGIQRSTGTMGALLGPLEPIGIVIGGLLFLGERLSLTRALAIGLGCAGALAIVSQGHFDASLGDPTGDALIAAGHLSWAVYTVASKPLLDRHAPMHVALAVVLLSLVPIGLLATTESFDLEQAKQGLVWVVTLAFLGTAVGTWTWNYALHHTTAGTMATFIFLQPVVGLAAGALALGEPVGALAVGGAAVVAAGVAIEARFARGR